MPLVGESSGQSPPADANRSDAVFMCPLLWFVSVLLLFASAGGDCPELSMSGMLQALSTSDDGGDLFMFTDASSRRRRTSPATSPASRRRKTSRSTR